MSRNRGFDFSERLPQAAAGRSVLSYLAQRYRHSSVEDWRSRIEAGRVLLDADPVTAETLLRPGQSLIWQRDAWNEPDAPTSFSVIHEDDDLLAVAKPAGLPTLPGGGFFENTLLRRIRSRSTDATPLHRLGRWTSGIVLFAKTDRARRRMSRQWAEREIGKRYRALASGRVEHDTFRVDVPIGPVPHALLETVHGATPSGKPASSSVTVLERRESEFLCDVAISTGRPHQIRIHLAAAGHPLVGDPLYAAGGRPRDGCRALPGDPGYQLHAAELVFRHPQSGDRITLACTPPRTLRPAPRREGTG